MVDDIKVYTITEIAVLLKVNRRTVWNYIKEGKLVAKKVGGKWLITEKNLKDFVGA